MTHPLVGSEPPSIPGWFRQTTTYAYDDGGRLASQTDPLGHRLFLNSYDPATGRIVEQLDATGGRTTFGWDAATQTARTTDPNGGVWTHLYQDNVLLAETNPLGKTTSYTFDHRLNRTGIADPLGNVTSMDFDDRGNMVSRIRPTATSPAESYTYTPTGELLTYTDRRRNVAMRNTYDDATGLLATSTDAKGGVTRYSYTARGQVATITDRRGKVTTFGYDQAGNTTSITMPSGARRR